MVNCGLPYKNIVEATPRNTAAAIAFAALAVQPEDILIVTPSDHMISGYEKYEEAIQMGVQKAQEGYIVTFGIHPTRPETGYGYIEYEDNNVISFREKPNLDTAEDFLERGNFLWNSGMFCFQAAVFLKELEQYEPKVFEKAKKVWEKSKCGILDETLSLEIPSISVDYAVMERSKKIRVVSTSFEWSDLGSFESLYDYFIANGYPKDDNGNIVIGTEVFTGFVGLRNTLFIHTKDAFLIVQKEKSQDVKKIYNMLDKHQSKLLD
jgi:mannose-1-phosphate guanylyltransferase